MTGVAEQLARAGARDQAQQAANGAVEAARKIDDPDSLDLARNPNRHTTLGHGVHYCLGAALARMELREAISGFLERYAGYEIDAPDVIFMDRTASRRLTSLPVAIVE